MDLKTQRKDSFKRSVVVVIFWLFLFYLAYLLLHSVIITTSEYANRNIPIYIILIWICLYMVGLYWLYPIHIKFSRGVSLVMWLAFIIISQTMLLNDWASHVYIWDIFSVLWVLILILFPTNILTTEKVKKAKAKKNEVIIEV